MNVRLWLIFTQGGFIGTVIIFENVSNVYSIVDLLGYFENDGVIYLDSEIHNKFSFDKPINDNAVLVQTLQNCIPSYTTNKLTYQWCMIVPSQYDTHTQVN